MTRKLDEEDSILASRLREARMAIGLTQEDVAKVMEMRRTAISEIEWGHRKVYGGELRRFSRLYRRPVAWLLGDEDPAVGEDVRGATEGLSERDRHAVLSFARFLAHQAASAPLEHIPDVPDSLGVTGGLVYCKRCGVLLASESRGVIDRSGRPCRVVKVVMR